MGGEHMRIADIENQQNLNIHNWTNFNQTSFVNVKLVSKTRFDQNSIDLDEMYEIFFFQIISLLHIYEIKKIKARQLRNTATIGIFLWSNSFNGFE